jgi:hypothetical protein
MPHRRTQFTSLERGEIAYVTTVYRATIVVGGAARPTATGLGDRLVPDPARSPTSR